MPTVPQLTCIVESHPQGAAITYTLRLLASLIGHRAVIRPATDDSDGEPDIYYGTDAATAASAHLWIRPDTQFWGCIPPAKGATPNGRQEWHGSVFPVWEPAEARTDDVGNRPNICPVDLIAAAFFLVSRAEEYVARRRDRHGRFRAADAWMCRNGLGDRPLVHEYARAIAGAIGRTDSGNRLSSVWPDGGRFAIAFTHDIDRLRMHGGSWLDLLRGLTALRAGGSVRGLTRRLASRWAVRAGERRDPYDTLDDICQRHAAHGFRATFFWIAASPSRRDADYTPKHPIITAQLRQLQETGHECGLHASYDSLNDRRRLENERAELASAAGAPIRAI
ncbi:MAG TPA: hypothetical protein VM118_13140, partial [Acidobacteriota bacterium]|nr:hypothetical protein [Acidobacteriota bacterium]